MSGLNGFALRFFVLFALLMGALEAARDTPAERAVVQGALLRPTVALIGVLTPDEPVALDGRTIVTPGSRLNVIRGCEGTETLLLGISAVLAYPAPARRRWRGLLVISTLGYGLSIARLVALHYTLRYLPGAWEALHGSVLPLLPIVGIGTYFLYWSARVPAAAADAPAA